MVARSTVTHAYELEIRVNSLKEGVTQLLHYIKAKLESPNKECLSDIARLGCTTSIFAEVYVYIDILAHLPMINHDNKIGAKLKGVE